MKVTICAHDNAGNPSSGPRTWLTRLVPYLLRNGIEVRALIYYWGEIKNCPLVTTLKQEGVLTDCLSYDELPYVEDQVKWTLERLNAFKPDVFIPNHPLPALYSVKWCNEIGIPTVAVVHSNDKYYHYVIETFVTGRSDFTPSVIVCVSEFLERLVKKRVGNGLRVERISCGSPVPQGSAKSPFAELRLIYAGRLVEDQKRILTLAEVFCECSLRFDSVQASIYGQGPQRQKVAKIIASRGCQDSVFLPDPVLPSQIQSVMQQHHVFVLLSDYEGLPVSLLEAMACGLVPVCLAEESGVNEVVRHNINGLIVKDRSEDFYRAIERLKNEKGFWERLSKEARRTVEKKYSTDIENCRWVELIRECSLFKRTAAEIRVPAIVRLPNLSSRDFETRRPSLARQLWSDVYSLWMKLRLSLRPRTRLKTLVKRFKSP